MGKSLQDSLIAANTTPSVRKSEKKTMSFKFFIGALALLLTNAAQAQVNVTASAGAPSGSYPTLRIAIDSVNSGFHQGAITINIPAAGAENNPTGSPIIINGSGVGAASYSSLNITATAGYIIYAGTGTATPTSTFPDGIIALNGADNVQISGFTLTDNNTTNPGTMEYGIGLFKVNGSNGCQNNVIQNNTINLKLINNVAGGANLADGSTGILVANCAYNAATTAITNVSAAGGNSNNTIAGNAINFTNTGIALMGFSAAASAVADINNTIGGTTAAAGNIINNFGGVAGATAATAGIRAVNQWDATIRYNVVNNNTGATGAANSVSPIRGIYSQIQPGASGTISNNTVTIKNGATGATMSAIENTLAPGATAAAGPIGTVVSINDNLVTNCAVFQGTTVPFYGIYNNGVNPATLNMNGNTLHSNTSAATTGATWMISHIPGTSVGHNATAINMNNNVIGTATQVGMAFNGTAAYTGTYNGLTVQVTNTATMPTVPPDLNWNYNTCENSISFPATLTGTGQVNHFFTGSTTPPATTSNNSFYRNVKVVGNTVKNILTNHNGSLYGMYLWNLGGSTSVNVDSNTIDNLRRTGTATTGLFYGIYCLGFNTAASAPVSVKYNRVMNCFMPNAGTGVHSGLFVAHLGISGTAPRQTVEDNLVSNNHINTTGTTAAMQFYSFGDGVPAVGSVVKNNRVVGNRYFASSSGIAIVQSGSVGTIPVAFSENIVELDTLSNPTGVFAGLNIASTPIQGMNIFRNNISRLVHFGAPTTPFMTGAAIVNNTSPAGVNFYNNIIGDFRSPSNLAPAFSRYTGVQVSGSQPTTIRFNTISIDSAGFMPAGIHGATGISYGATAGSTLRLHNNIIRVNQLSSTAVGQVSAVRRNLAGTANTAPPVSGSTTGTNFDANNNIYWVPQDSMNFYYVEGTSISALTNGFKPYDAATPTLSGSVTPASNIVIDTNFNSSCGLYKKFMTSPREAATFTENNLNYSVSPNVQYVPSGISFAEKGAAVLTNPVITTDYANAPRTSTPDIGALQFAGTVNDLAGPAISFTPIPNTICDNNPIINVTITDPSGVLSITPGTKPRLYFKKASNANVLPTTNTFSTDGWKWVEAINTSSPYQFTMNYGLLFPTGGVAAGDEIHYFFVAQDQTPLNNFSSSSASFPSAFCPDSVNLDAAAFPVTGTSSFTILQAPLFISAQASPSTLCGSGTSTLSLVGAPYGGATFQWQVQNASGSFVNIPGAVADTFVASNLTNTTTFRCQIFCNGVPISPGSPTTPITVNVYAPSVLTTTPDTRCGPGVVNLGATASVGDTVKWYANPTGGNVLATGTTYSPTVASTTTFYAAAQSPLGAHLINTVNPATYTGATYFTSTSQYSQTLDVTNPAGLYLDSVDMYFNNTTSGTIQVLVYDNTGTNILQSGPVVNVSVAAVNPGGSASIAAANRRAVAVGLYLPQGQYRISTATSITSTPYYAQINGASPYPFNTAAPGIASNTQGFFGLTTPNTNRIRFFRFYMRASCASTPRTAVVATVTAPPAVTATGSPTGTVCIGSPYSLTATSSNSGYTYTWNPGAVSGATPTVTIAGATVFTVTASDASTGCAATSTVGVTVFAPPPFIGVSNSNPSVCAGGSSTLAIVDSAAVANVPPPSGYCATTYTQAGQTGDFVNNFSLTGPSGALITNNNSGDGVGPGGCASCDYILFNNLPVPDLLPGATYSISCQAGTVFSQGFRLYIDWNRDATFQASEEIMNFASSTAVNNGTFTVPTTAQPGRTHLRVQCKFASIPATTEVCAVTGFGETEDYIVRIGYPNSPATSITWNPNANITPVVAGNNFTVVAGPVNTTTTYTATALDANGCSVTKTTTINVGPVVCSPVTSSNSLSCPCATVTLTASAVGGATPYSYEWKNSAGTVIGLAQNVVVSPCSTETYTVKIKSTDPGCTDSCTTTYTQNVSSGINMTFTNTAGGPIQICGNTQSSVSVTPSGATGYTITGTPLPTPSSSATGPFVFNNIATTTYTVTGSNAAGCTLTTTLVVTYRKKDTIEIRATPGTSVCGPLGTVTLSISDTVFGPSNPRLYCIPSHSSASFCISNVSFGTLTNNTGGTCTLPSYTSYTSLPVPLVVKGTNVPLTIDVNAAISFASAWIDFNRDGDFSDLGEYHQVVIGNPNGTLNIPIPGNAVEGITTMRIRSASANVGISDSCTTLPDGETEDYLIRVIRTQTPLTAYSWTCPSPPNNAGNTFNTSTSNPTVATGFSGSTINPNQTVFVVTTTDANGCTNQTTIGINTGPLTASAITANATTRCSGAPLQLSANAVGGGMPYTYAWVGSNGFTGSGQIITDFPTNTTNAAVTVTYTVTITDACSPSASTSTTINIIVNPTPIVQYIVGNQPMCTAGVSNIAISNTGLTGPKVQNSYTFAPTTFLAPSAGPGPFTWTPGVSNVYTITAVNSSTGCTNTSTINLVFSPAYNVVTYGGPNSVGPCGGTVTICAVDTNVTGNQSDPNCYAVPGATSNTAGDHLVNVVFPVGASPNISHASGACTPSTPTGYCGLITSQPIPTVLTNSTYQLQVGVNNAGTEYAGAWFDWNRNCTFEASEFVNVPLTLTSGTWTGTVNVTVPNGATPGVVRMRVRSKYSSALAATDALAAYTWGETEDYLINIVKVPSVYPFTNYAWAYTNATNNITPVGGNTNCITFAPPALPTTQTYTVTATNSVGCTGTGTYVITIGPLACLTPTAKKGTICFGTCDTLTANPSFGSAPYTYSWVNSLGANVGSTQTISVCPTNTLTVLDSVTYTVTITDACNATCTSSVKVYIRPQIPLAIAPNGSDTLCGSGTKTLSAVPNTYTSYSWSPNLSLSSSTGATVTANPNFSVTYTVTATNSFGCTRTATEALTFSPVMFNTVSANPPTLGCADSVCLTIVDSSILGGPQTPPNYSNCTTTNASGSGSGVASVSFATMTNVTGNTAPNPAYTSFVGTVPAPNVDIGSTYNLTLTYDAAGAYSGGTAVVFFDWDRDGTFSASEYTSLNQSFTSGTTQTFSITIPPTASLGVTVMRIRTRGITNGINSANGCGSLGSGETEDYAINVRIPPPVPPITYTNIWNGGNLVNVPGLTVCDSINATTTYTVTATNSFGCTSQNTITINLGNLTCGPITGPDSACSGVPFNLTATTLAGGTISSYVWTGTGTSSANAATQNIVVTNNTATPQMHIYSVTLTDACNATCSKVDTVWVKPAPVVSISTPTNVLCGVNTVALTGSSTHSGNINTASVVWSAPSGASVSPAVGSLNTTATLPPGGVFTLTVTDVLGCTGTSTVNLTYSPPFSASASANPSVIGGCATTVTLSAVPSSVTATYCVPTFTSSDYNEIMNFGVGTSAGNYNIINNPTGCNVTGGGAANGLPASIMHRYSNFTSNPISNISIKRGTTYNFTYSIDTCVFANNGILYAYTARIFIDLNRDGDFVDANEAIYTPATYGVNAHTVTDTFRIPVTAVINPGPTVLRIVSVSTLVPSGITPCGNYGSGEAEDYLVNLYDSSATYTWSQSTGGGLAATNGPTVTANPSGQSSYTYTLTVADGAGCTATSSVVVNSSAFNFTGINALSKSVATAVCSGKCDTVKLTKTGGSPAYVSSFSPTTGMTQINDSIWLFCAPATTTYTVTYADACGISSTQTVTLNVRPKPTISWPGGADSVVSCTAPASLTIPSPVSTGTLVTWSPAGPPGTFTFNNPTIYTVTATDQFGCTNTGNFKALVNYPHNIKTKVVPALACYGARDTLSFTDTTLAVGPQSDPNCYTLPGGTINTSLDAITNVTFPTTGVVPNISNPTGACPPTPGLPNGYCGVQAVVAPTINTGTVHTLSVSVENGGTEYAAAWFDWNRNCTFEASEWVNVPLTLGSGVWTGTAVVAVPINATPGITRMRVRSRYNSPFTAATAAADAIGSYTWGETEDYLINIVSNGPAALSNWYWTNGVDTTTPSTNPSITKPLTATSVYTLTVVGFGGCTYTSTVNVVVNPKINVTSVQSTDISCNGFTDGIIITSASGGASGGTLTPSIKPVFAGTGGTFTQLPAGIYTVTYTDNIGCKDSLVDTLTQPNQLVNTFGFKNQNACFGDSTASVFATVTGGTGPYGYTWTDTNGVTLLDSVSLAGDTIYNLKAGKYVLVVYDNNLCNITDTVVITQPSAPLDINVVVTDNVKCFGDSTGIVTATATGGTPTYKYNIDGGAFTNLTGVFNGLKAGTYTIGVQDFTNVCTDYMTITVGQPATAVSASAVVDSNVLCSGGANGKATASASGGTSPYTYSWNNGGGSAATASGLAANSYIVTATDANGCTATSSITITEPTALSISAVVDNNVSCNGGSNGQATASASGGTSPYTYSWSNGGGAATASGLAANSYVVTVTDANGCTATSSVTITEPATSVTVSAVVDNDVSCKGGTDGKATATASGGTGTITYSWNNGGGSAATAVGLAANSYVVTATDANGCTATSSVTITEPATGVTVTAVVDNNVSCNGGANGKATATASGGTGTITYSWNNGGGSSATASGLAAISYIVTATDANGCTATSSITITEPTVLSVSAVVDNNVSCNGGSNGQATASASGGTSPYTYSWNNGGGAATASGLAANSYVVTVTDANGCTTTSSVTITEPAANVTVSAVVDNDVSCKGGTDGKATATASGGTGTITYSWNNGGGSAATASGLAANSYVVTVTDANGCTATASVTITEPATNVTVSAVVDNNVSCNGGTNGQATASASGGTAPYSYSWNSGAGSAATANNLSAGSYVVTATDAHGCTATTSVTISQPTPLTATASAVQPSCSTGPVTITVSASGGTAAYSGIGTFTVTAENTYSYTVTDANSCTATTTIFINYPDPVVITNVTITNATCFNGNDGEVVITASGGTSASGTYVITPATTNLAAGTYVFVVEDDNGCTADTTVIVDDGAEILFAIDTLADAACAGANGYFELSVSGGAPTLSLAITNGATVANPYVNSNAPAGVYSFTATDAKGCTATTSVSIVAQNNNLGVKANASALALCNNTVVTLWGSNTSGISNMIYTWDNGVTDSVPFSLTSGVHTYIVSGTDPSTGCGQKDTITITSAVQAALLAQASAMNATSLAGNSCDVSFQPNGSTVDYVDASCNLIATVADASGGNMLGNVEACVTVHPTIQTWNGDPYAARTYNIVPTNNGPAVVTLYYTTDDILDYNNWVNANGNTVPLLNIPSATPADGDVITNAQISKFTDTLGIGSVNGFYNVILVYSAADMRWSTTFAIPSFSYFYLHTSSNPLSVQSIVLEGSKVGSTDVLTWTTTNEKNVSHFDVLRGSTASNMQIFASNIPSKAVGGTSTGSLSYKLVDEKPQVGHNYYQVQAIDQSGQVVGSNVVDIYWALNGASVIIYPNPALNDLHVDINIERATPAHIRIYDATGRLVKQIHTQLEKGMNNTVVDLGDIASGIYMIKISDNKGLDYSQQFRKN